MRFWVFAGVACGVLVLAGAGRGQGLLERFVGLFTSVGAESMADIEKVGIISEDPSVRLTRRPVVSIPIGRITDVFIPADSPRGPIGAVIAGDEGAATTDGKWSVVRRVDFNTPCVEVEVLPHVDVSRCMYVDRGGGWQPTSLIGADGKVLWTYHGNAGVDNMAAGHFAEPAVWDFVVGMNGGGGVIRLDSSGKEVWNEEGANVWHVEIADVDGKGVQSIVHTDASGSFTIRDASGKRLRSIRSPVYAGNFSVCAWPGHWVTPRALVPSEKRISAVDLADGTAQDFEAPGCHRSAYVRSTLVRLGRKPQDLLAVLVSYPLSKRAVVYLFGAGGGCVYSEVLPGSGSAVRGLPLAGGAESLLIGGEGVVWQLSS